MTDVEKGDVVTSTPAPTAGSANVEDFKQQSLRRKSLKVQLEESKAESKGPLNFILACCCIISGSIGFTILLGVILAIPIATIAIGSVYLKDCPRQDYIPIYLIVAGCFSIVNILSRIIRRACFSPQEEEKGKVDVKSNLLETVVGLFIFAWFIAGSVWIYGCYHDVNLHDKSDEDKYCNPILYYFAFWITTISYILLAFSLCCCCIAGCLASFRPSS